jgi:hypothetical protein
MNSNAKSAAIILNICVFAGMTKITWSAHPVAMQKPKHYFQPFPLKDQRLLPPANLQKGSLEPDVYNRRWR